MVCRKRSRDSRSVECLRSDGYEDVDGPVSCHTLPDQEDLLLKDIVSLVHVVEEYYDLSSSANDDMRNAGLQIPFFVSLLFGDEFCSLLPIHLWVALFDIAPKSLLKSLNLLIKNPIYEIPVIDIDVITIQKFPFHLVIYVLIEILGDVGKRAKVQVDHHGVLECISIIGQIQVFNERGLANTALTDQDYRRLAPRLFREERVGSLLRSGRFHIRQLSCLLELFGVSGS